MNEKADILTQKLIDRFCLLEQYIPRANKGNYKPTKVPVLWDVLETQDIAYEMMCFAGLNEYTP